MGWLSGRRGLCRTADESLCTDPGAVQRLQAGAGCVMNRASGVVILVLLTGLGIGATYVVQHISAPRIAAEQRLIDSRNLLDLLPPDSYDNQPLEQPLGLAGIVLPNSTLLGGYRVTKSGQPSAVL